MNIGNGSYKTLLGANVYGLLICFLLTIVSFFLYDVYFSLSGDAAVISSDSTKEVQPTKEEFLSLEKPSVSKNVEGGSILAVTV
jgi:hypothetical protein